MNEWVAVPDMTQIMKINSQQLYSIMKDNNYYERQ